MKKNIVIVICIFTLVIMLCASCSDTFGLPDESEITSVILEHFSDGKTNGAVELTEKDEISEIHAVLSFAQKTKETSSGNYAMLDYIKTSLYSDKTELRQVFIYANENGSFLEEIDVGIYKLSKELDVYSAFFNVWSLAQRKDFGIVFADMLKDSRYALPENYTEANKAISLFTNEFGDKSLHRYNLPEIMRAELLNDVRFLVLGFYKEELIGEYTFGTDESIRPKAFRIDEQVSIIDLSTGQLIAESIFKGGDPPATVSGSETKAAYGSAPVIYEIEQWISEQLEIALRTN